MSGPNNTRRLRKPLFLGLGALVVLGLVAASFPRGGATTATAATTTTALPALPARRPAAGLRLRWQVGEVRTYDVRVTSRTAVALAEAFPGAPAKRAARPVIATSVQGLWRTEVFAEQEGDALVRAGFEVRELNVSANGLAVDRSSLDALRAPAALPVVLRLGRDGHVAGLRVPTELAAQPLLVGTLKTLVAALQAVYPADGADAWRWQGVEQDGAGAYLASYARSDDGLVKRKGDYRALGGLTGVQPPGNASLVPESRAALTIDPAGWVLSVSLRETLTLRQKSDATTDQPDQIVAEASNEVDATQIASAVAGGVGPPPGWQELPEWPLAHAFAAPPSEPLRSLPELLGDLRSTDRQRDAGEREQAQARLMPELADGLRRNPRAAQALGTELRAAGVERGRASTLLAALSTAGTPEAQHELVAAWRDAALEASVRAQALAQLAFVEQPSPEAAGAASEAATSPDVSTRRRGGLVLGAIAHQLGAPAESDPSGPLVETLLGLARSAQEDTALIAAIDALGNAGSPASMGVLLAGLRSPSPGVRNAAVRALRLMPPGPADGAIRQTLLVDPATGVRQGAVFAAGFRDPRAFAEVFTARVVADSSPAVRAALVAALATGRPTLPSFGTTLEQVARDDADESVREAARRALAGPTMNEGASTTYESDAPSGGP